VPPGVYTGTIAIREDGVLTWQIPINLQVRNFALPDLPSARTMLYLCAECINDRYLGEAYPEPGTSVYIQSLELADRHFQLAHRHKLSLIDESIEEIEQMDEAWTERLNGQLFTAVQGYDGVGVGVGNNVYSIGTYGSWSWQGGTQADMWAHTDAWARWFDGQAFASPTDYFLYLIDESDDYPQIEQWAGWINGNPGPGQRLMSLATIDLPTAASNTPALDIPTSWMTVGITDQWQSAATSYQADPDKRFYLYNGNRPAAGSLATEDEGVALRVLAWAQYKKKIDRWLYWETTYYDNFQGNTGQTNVFQTAQTFGDFDQVDSVLGETGWNYLNGDGVLFYPGTDTRYPEESYSVMGPFASLRLKQWRRGIQDVDYLRLAEVISPTRVAEIVGELIPQVLWEYGVSDPEDPTWLRTDISWSIDPDVWEAARAELAGIIESGSTEVPGSVHLPLVTKD
ncbi:MAG TPA: glycoside hydrolase domain-containing protein, partial [Anaerolineae bacterium]|nr:glycoside hydrolase domain-containing protein [Anaerolineae bacterium]